jgi:hypothetical protein
MIAIVVFWSQHELGLIIRYKRPSGSGREAVQRHQDCSDDNTLGFLRCRPVKTDVGSAARWRDQGADIEERLRCSQDHLIYARALYEVAVRLWSP